MPSDNIQQDETRDIPLTIRNSLFSHQPSHLRRVRFAKAQAMEEWRLGGRCPGADHLGFLVCREESQFDVDAHWPRRIGLAFESLHGNAEAEVLLAFDDVAGGFPVGIGPEPDGAEIALAIGFGAECPARIDVRGLEVKDRRHGPPVGGSVRHDINIDRVVVVGGFPRPRGLMGSLG